MRIGPFIQRIIREITIFFIRKYFQGTKFLALEHASPLFFIIIIYNLCKMLVYNISTWYSYMEGNDVNNYLLFKYQIRCLLSYCQLSSLWINQNEHFIFFVFFFLFFHEIMLEIYTLRLLSYMYHFRDCSKARCPRFDLKR